MRSILICLALTLTSSAFATHTFGGEIYYVHVSGFTYAITVHYYTKTSSPADRPEIVLIPGDGSAGDTLPRTMETYFPNDWKLNVYEGVHTYPGFGRFTLTFEDPNRNQGILNIPMSVNEAFCVSTVLVIDAVLGPNNSVRFTNYQHISWYSGAAFFHETMPADIDGDSLSFELIDPLGDGCDTIPGYALPSTIPAGNYCEVGVSSGVFGWYDPVLIGQYVIAIRCTERRNGELIGQVTRDMSLIILPGATATNEIGAKPTISISSTVSGGLFNIRTYQAGVIAVMDVQGRSIRNMRTDGDLELVDLTNEPDGVYLITMVDLQGISVSERIIKSE